MAGTGGFVFWGVAGGCSTLESVAMNSNWSIRLADKAVKYATERQEEPRMKHRSNTDCIHLCQSVFHLWLSLSCGLWTIGRLLFARDPLFFRELTDCLSFCIMNELRLSEALTTDAHFEQAGFVSLLK
jgi:hypothetical protein